MSEIIEFRRGDVVFIPFPYITDFSKSRERPAVIIQNDVGNRFSPNLIVAAISSQIPSREYPIHFLVRKGSSEVEGTGLQMDSIVQTEIILTIPKTSVTKRLGRFNGAAMSAIDQCLRVSLALT
jgi:mRNA interferase MazF